MEFKKCNRCGCFFVAENDVCGKCIPKDETEIIKLRNYFDNNSVVTSLEEISNTTGITVKNLDRHINTDEFKYVSKALEGLGDYNSDFNNLSINL